MTSDVVVGKDRDGRDVIINPIQDSLRFIFVTGESGSGKSTLSKHLLSSWMRRSSPEELGVVIFDMKRVEFSGWSSSFLRKPIITGSREAFDFLTDLANHAELQAEIGDPRMLVVLIEECDVAYVDLMGFEAALLRIIGSRANVCVIFQTSRPSPDFITPSLVAVCDLMIVHKGKTEEDSMYLLGEAGAEKLTKRGEKIMKYRQQSPFYCSDLTAAQQRAAEDYFYEPLS